MLRFVCLSSLLASGVIALGELVPTQQINLEEAYKSEIPRSECSSANPLYVTFNLYTRNKPYDAEILKIDDDGETIRNSGYNVKKPTKFLIHSWLQSVNVTHRMIPDYLYTQDVNIIVVDWSTYANRCNLKSTQNIVVPTVVKALVILMKELIAYGSTAETDFHLIGYGVGAHIAAQAAKKLTPVKFNRISALDPIGYKFNEPGRWKLQNSDALFVDVIYTSIPLVAADRDLGDVTFYPNGGKHPQPGCDNEVICSSLASIKLWQKSITTPIKAWKCDNYDHYEAGACKHTFVYVGEHVSHDARGKFYVSTESLYHSSHLGL